jgi:hypothetical protein
MRYMLLIYGDPAAVADMTPEEGEAEMQKWFTYSAEMAEAGVMLGGDPLEDVTTATSVQVRDGQTLTTDGPFAETKEILGGYYMLDVPDLDAAVTWAAKCPGAVHGTIELRPVQELPGM